MLIAFSLLSLASTSPALQDSEKTFRVEEIESPAAAGSDASQLVLGLDGSAYLAWFEREETGQASLRLARWTGEGFGAPLTVTSGEGLMVSAVDPPAVAVSREGALAVSWLQENGGEGHARDARISVSADGGKSWSAPATLHDDRSPSEHGFVSLQPLDSGGFLAVWLDGRKTLGPASDDAHAAGGDSAHSEHAARKEHGGHGGGHQAPVHYGPTELWSRTVALDGKLGPEVLVDDRVCDCCTTDMVRTEKGGLLAAWRDRSDAEYRDIWFARFSERGWSKSVPVNDDGWVMPGCPLNGPALAASGGRIACAWFTGGDRNGVFLSLMEPAAKGFSAPMRVDSGGAVGKPAVAFLADGSLAVVFLDHDEEGDAWRVARIGSDKKLGSLTLIAYTGSSMSMMSGIPGLVEVPDALLVSWLEPEPAARVRVARIRVLP